MSTEPLYVMVNEEIVVERPADKSDKPWGWVVIPADKYDFVFSGWSKTEKGARASCLRRWLRAHERGLRPFEFVHVRLAKPLAEATAQYWAEFNAMYPDEDA